MPHRGHQPDRRLTCCAGSSWSAPGSPACARPRRCGSSGFAGDLTIAGGEPHEPYDRPPLSKQLLAAPSSRRRARCAGAPGVEADWRLGRHAGSPSTPAPRRVTLDDGDELPLDGLVIADRRRRAGRGRWPPRRRWTGVHVLRSLRRRAGPCGRRVGRARGGSRSWGPGSSAARSRRRCALRGSPSRWSTCSRSRLAPLGAGRRRGIRRPSPRPWRGAAARPAGGRARGRRRADGRAAAGRRAHRRRRRRGRARRGARRGVARGVRPGRS